MGCSTVLFDAQNGVTFIKKIHHRHKFFTGIKLTKLSLRSKRFNVMLQTNHIAYYLKHEKIGQKCMSPCNEKRGVPRHSSNGLGNIGQHTAMTPYIYGNLYVFQICVQYGKCSLSTVLKI